MMVTVFAPLMVIVGSGSGGILSQIVGLGGGAQVPRCLGAAQELGWEDKKSVIGVINGNCVMMALLQALPTAGHFRGGCNGFCPWSLLEEKTKREREIQTSNQDYVQYSCQCDIF